MLQNLKNLHRVVARELALGLTIEEICEARNLDLSSWKRIISKPIFQNALQDLHKEIDNQLIEDSKDDPVLSFMRSKALKAAQRLSEEMDNFDNAQGASSTTRITASKSLLDRIGYNSRDPEQAQNVVKIELSADKINFAKTKISSLPQETTILSI
jgi:hypothetical protein